MLKVRKARGVAYGVDALGADPGVVPGGEVAHIEGSAILDGPLLGGEVVAAGFAGARVQEEEGGQGAGDGEPPLI